jgi:hypothetical protein
MLEIEPGAPALMIGTSGTPGQNSAEVFSIVASSSSSITAVGFAGWAGIIRGELNRGAYQARRRFAPSAMASRFT